MNAQRAHVDAPSCDAQDSAQTRIGYRFGSHRSNDEDFRRLNRACHKLVASAQLTRKACNSRDARHPAGNSPAEERAQKSAAAARQRRAKQPDCRAGERTTVAVSRNLHPRRLLLLRALRSHGARRTGNLRMPPQRTRDAVASLADRWRFNSFLTCKAACCAHAAPL
jgi:hypothetical protein